MKKIVAVFLITITMLLSVLPVLAQPVREPNRLRLNESGELKILHLTDTQDDQNPAYDMLNLLKTAIDSQKPDLIVFTGDLVEDKHIGDLGIDDESLREGVCVYDKKGNVLHDETLANIKKVADVVFSIFESYQIPYIVTLGNNDYKCSITNKEWLDILSGYEHCLVKDMSDDPDGRIDSYMLIEDASGNPVYNLWFMDTGRGGVTSDQIAWYKTTEWQLEQTYGRKIPATVFQHIQVAEIGNLFTEYAHTGIYGINSEIASGYHYYAYKPGGESDEFKAWVEMGDVKAAYFGHQHKDGFTGTYQGIELGFTYGMEFAKSAPHGFRTVTVTQNENGTCDTQTSLFCYQGNVKLGNASIVLQEDDSANDTLAVLARFFSDLLKAFISLFADW